MFRLLPPRDRVSRLVLLAGLMLSVLFVGPAGAVEPPDIKNLEVPTAVTGRDALTIATPGLETAVTVAIRDADGNTSSWTFGPNTDPLVVNLDAPDSGPAPVNGKAALKIRSEATGNLLSRLVTLDRAAATPQLEAVVRGQRVGLFWNAVPGPGTVTYRLQRTGGATAWETIAESASVGYTDRGLAPGRYRYRLVAAVPGADGTPNLSGLDAVQLRIAAPAPTPEPEPEPEPSAPVEPADSGESDDSDATKDKPAKDARDVTATGNVRGPVTSPPPSSDLADSKPQTPLVRGTADAPAVTSGMPATQTVPAPVATPEIAPAAPPTPLTSDAEVPSLDYFPVIVPPAGSLAVEAAGSAGEGIAADVVTLLAGVTFLGMAASGVRRRRRVPTT